MTTFNLEDESARYLDEVFQDTEEIEQMILTIKNDDDKNTYLKQIRRKIHSIKGTAAPYGFDLISIICHKIEDRISSLELVETQLGDFIDSLLQSKDLLLRTCQAYKKKSDEEIKELKRSIGVMTDHKSSSLNVAQKKMRALIVEPSKMISRKVAQLLSSFSVEVAISRDGYESLGRLLKEQFDILVISLNTSLINAVDLIEILSILKHFNKDIPCFITTSSDDQINIGQRKNFKVIKKDIQFEESLRKEITHVLQGTKESADRGASKKYKLLVVDDSDDIHKLLKLALSKIPDIEMKSCSNPLDALGMALGEKPDCILLDVQMPQLSGEELFKLLKKNNDLNNTAICFLTGSDTAEEIKTLKALNPAQIFKKPFDLIQFPKDLRSFLQALHGNKN